MANLIHSALIGVFIFAGTCPGIAIGQTCPPANLNQRPSVNDPTFNEELASFSYRSKTYPVAVFSDFTKQRLVGVSNPNFCIRYAVENKAKDIIEKFYWPLAGLQMDTINPQQRPSLAITKPPGRDPTVDETWIYAFLNSVARTYAFQRRAARSINGLIQVALNTDNDRGATYPKPRDLQLSALEAIEQRLELKAPIEFSDVGSEFSSGAADEISTSSRASWNGETSEIQIRLGRSNEKTLVFAPITYALLKAGNASDFISLIREFTRKAPQLPFDKDNNFEFSRKVSPADFAGSQSLYVIEQPISLVTNGGNICFSSPMYSPIPIPSEFLQCRLF